MTVINISSLCYLRLENKIRRGGSYLYEQFLNTREGKDVKVYMVGDSEAIRYRDDDPFHVFAEQRKAPTVDGIVERDSDGLERRQVIQLTRNEINMAKKIMIGFKQMICGFDFLRVIEASPTTTSDGDAFVSLVNDVNGFSSVKHDNYFYVRSAEILSRKLAFESQQ